MSSKKNGLRKQSYPEDKVDQAFPIVGIGASAGGLDPIRKLLENLPIDTGLSFVVIQHLASGQESMLPEILSRSTKMKVIQVEDGMKVEQNHVYVINPGTTMTLKNGFLKLVPKGTALKPINDFLISLASELKTKAIGIVLSGTGNDGTEGLKAIKDEDGITFAQDPETAQYPDMPKNAIAANAAFFVLSPEKIAEELTALAKHPQLSQLQKIEDAKEGSDLKKIYLMLKVAFGTDFTHYKETTMNRRITRRMAINKTAELKTYLEYLKTHPVELQALFDDLLIGVTSFFREPKTFLALKEKVFPEIIKKKSQSEPVRVWVPGCSTGEEVYSLAIGIQEYLEEKLILDVKIQIFGTDVNEKNIEKARQGTYRKSIEDNVSESRLKKFFRNQDDSYQIAKSIREMCIFAKQDITSDPPFSKLDLIVCRNMLIYFDFQLQERVVPIFHYGLKDGGFLILGESESASKFQNLFEALTNKGVIYRKKLAQPQIGLSHEVFAPYSAKIDIKQPLKLEATVLLKDEVDRQLMGEYVPPTLLINNKLEILAFRGQINPYLTHEQGPASLNVNKIVRKELRAEVQTAVYTARKANKPFKAKVQFKLEGQPRIVNLKVKPLKMPQYADPFFLITFEEAKVDLRQETESSSSQHRTKNSESVQLRALREDLDACKLSMQIVNEEREATSEELRAAMEELQSSNEELQSTNEELQTSKEELQSSNEELQTLNEELKNRNQSLNLINDDLLNVLKNVELSVLIVNNDLQIRRFTPFAQQLFKIKPSDVGRSITDFHLGLSPEELEKAIRKVTTKLVAATQEVSGGQGRVYEMHIQPYLTVDKKVDGAVLSLIDITDRKKLENEQKRHSESLEQKVSEQAKELVDAERLSAIGATAGMVGHDIRNPLQAIASDVYLVKSDLSVVPEGEVKEGMKESLEGIEKNIEYINKIVQDLQDFVRPLKPTVQKTDLEALCREVLFENGVPKNIDATCRVEKEAKKLIADPAMLKRILSNLVNNAVQSMPEGGKLDIHAFQDAGEVVINVQDTGVGIPKAIRPKLFTPLFTTKSKGQGFGLAVIKRMTEALGGTVSFESKVGKGNKFIIR
ncbi:MAG: CheR family methyltransferase, partial [Candidatus Bathyarchaeia archaeon]